MPSLRKTSLILFNLGKVTFLQICYDKQVFIWNAMFLVILPFQFAFSIQKMLLQSKITGSKMTDSSVLLVLSLLSAQKQDGECKILTECRGVYWFGCCTSWSILFQADRYCVLSFFLSIVFFSFFPLRSAGLLLIRLKVFRIYNICCIFFINYLLKQSNGSVCDGNLIW